MKTVTVRIPVAVDENGRWACDVASCYGDVRNVLHTKRAFLDLHFSSTVQEVVWITAEVPIPEPVEVKGEVE